RLQDELANQVAPLGPTAPGSPVAVLDIPAIGIRDMVVVQGTSPENMTLGPGHLRDTPMPGQAGVSEIFGRRATFGAPFARLAGADGALVLTFTWGVALAGVSALGTYGALRWSLWAAYLAAVPVAIAVLWLLYQSLSMLLPNVY